MGEQSGGQTLHLKAHLSLFAAASDHFGPDVMTKHHFDFRFRPNFG